MQNKNTPQQDATKRPLRDRVGLVVNGVDTVKAVKTIVAAEAAGVRQIWMTQSPGTPDTLTMFAAAAVQTATIRLGTSIIPTYSRHPITMAQQALSINDLAPGRLRLGIGSSHRPTIEGSYGLEMVSPLRQVHEYLDILRTLLWEGKIEHEGRFFRVKATLPRTAQVPLLISTLREGAFEMAGEISDGALSWLCPVPYLLKRALPALREGATRAGRSAPPLVAHVMVALSTDSTAVLAAARQRVQYYGKLPFYANMFADAGFPVEGDGMMTDALIKSLVISGDPQTVAARLRELPLDELLLLQIPVKDPAGEQAQLMELIGQL